MYMNHWATGSFGVKTHTVKWDMFFSCLKNQRAVPWRNNPLYMSSEQQSFDLLRLWFAVKSNLVFKCGHPLIAAFLQSLHYIVTYSRNNLCWNVCINFF